MPKIFTCCVPSCRSKLKIDDFFYFPMTSDVLYTWVAAIPDLFTTVTHNSVICKEHFGKQGQLGYNELNPPYIFPSLTPYDPNYMFSLPNRDDAIETLENCENTNLGDYIKDFCSLKKCYEKKIGLSLWEWKVALTVNTITFYKMHGKSIVRKVKCSIRINARLQIEIMLDGRKIDPLDLTWVLPPYSKITKWSQLIMLLKEFRFCNGTFKIKEVDTIRLKCEN